MQGSIPIIVVRDDSIILLHYSNGYPLKLGTGATTPVVTAKISSHLSLLVLCFSSQCSQRAKSPFLLILLAYSVPL